MGQNLTAGNPSELCSTLIGITETGIPNRYDPTKVTLRSTPIGITGTGIRP